MADLRSFVCLFPWPFSTRRRGGEGGEGESKGIGDIGNKASRDGDGLSFLCVSCFLLSVQKKKKRKRGEGKKGG